MKTGERITDELTLRLAITQRPEGTIAVSHDERGCQHINHCIKLYPSKWGPLCWLRIQRPYALTKRFCTTCGTIDSHP